ncbi:hypothetical protein O181_110150 [Austropuccinia psidii MF-1]|uniref:RRM domain-containing protein n=1 Tax=Austropuccinia psidii MF-1 TaxID=1389203 RepID=A0A9Q3JVT1_9BASI|nr:hypothetical protein [Austropuccinia psidii MF-1]
MITDNVTGKPKGYGYIEFDERDELVEAIKKSVQELGSRPIRIRAAEPRLSCIFNHFDSSVVNSSSLTS